MTTVVDVERRFSLVKVDVIDVEGGAEEENGADAAAQQSRYCTLTDYDHDHV